MDAKTIRGKNIIFHEGFQYVFDKFSANGITKLYRCRRRHVKCKGRIHVKNGIIEVLGNHGHEESATAVEVTSIITAIKKRAAETTEAPDVIINKFIESSTVAGRSALPSMVTLKKTVLRVQRQKTKTGANGTQMPVEPSSLILLKIPEVFRMYEVEPGRMENFLLCDTGPGLDRILMFGCQKGIDILSTSDDWYTDGMLKIAPTLFDQVFVIMAYYNGRIQPCIYAFLPNKEQETYTRLIVELRNRAPGIMARSISVDFEVAIHNSFRSEFPNIKIRGFFFHLLKNFEKQLASSGLMINYRNDADFRLNIRMITALAFVPPENVALYFEMLSDELEINYPSLKPILDWMEIYYIGILKRNGMRRLPFFPIPTWNLYAIVLNEQEKTYNIVEAAYRRLQEELSMTSPTIWKFIIGLKNVQAERDKFSDARHNPSPTNRKFEDACKQILFLVQNFGNQYAIEYLRGLANNFVMDH